MCTEGNHVMHYKAFSSTLALKWIRPLFTCSWSANRRFRLFSYNNRIIVRRCFVNRWQPVSTTLERITHWVIWRIIEDGRRYGISLRMVNSISHEIIWLIWSSWLDLRFKNRARCHSFMALNRASDVPAADWLSQTLVKNRNFSLVVTQFFLVVEIPINHYSLYNKVVLSSSSSSLALRCPVGSIAKNAST